MITRIPAPRVNIIDNQGSITREWYRFLSQVDEVTAISSDFQGAVTETRTSMSVDNDTLFLICSGTLTVALTSYSDRTNTLMISNVGTGTITIRPATGETIRGESLLTLDFQWSSVMLCPYSEGWVII